MSKLITDNTKHRIERIPRWVKIAALCIALPGAFAAMFGTGFISNVAADHYNQKLMRHQLDEVRTNVTKTDSVIDGIVDSVAENERGIAVIQEKISGIDERTKQTGEDVREIRQLIIQRVGISPP